MKILKATAVAVTLMFCMPLANALSDSERNTLEYMSVADNNLEDKGFTPMSGNDMTGSLEDMESTTHTRYFSAGNRYVIAAVCDEDCSDVDIWVHDKYGNEVADDADSSDFAITDFKATYDGEYSIKVRMYECDAAYCYYRVRMYQ